MCASDDSKFVTLSEEVVNNKCIFNIAVCDEDIIRKSSSESVDCFIEINSRKIGELHNSCTANAVIVSSYKVRLFYINYPQIKYIYKQVVERYRVE